jgi:hypothetical protein
MLFMLSVANKLIMLSVVMLNVVVPANGTLQIADLVENTFSDKPSG